MKEKNKIHNLKNDIEYVRRLLDSREELQTKALLLMREVVRNSGRAINSCHSKKPAEAKKYLDSAEQFLKELEEMSSKTKFYFRDYLAHAEQEYLEAKMFYHYLVEQRLLSLKELSMGEVSYLNALCDLIGELRRKMLQLLIDDQAAEAEKVFVLMQDIFDEVSTLKYSDSIAGDLRRKTDVARIQVENARSELFRYIKK